MQQHYKNHRKIVYGYYAFTGLPTLALVGIGIARCFNGTEAGRREGAVILLIGWILLTLLFRSRAFALKAQDRAIRAEEGLRHLLLTGKPSDPRLTLGQVIALRFAGDEEYPELAQRAAQEGLSGKAIKEQIKHWRADHYRV